MAESKRKCRQYSVEYLKLGLILSASDKRLPMCLLRDKILTNDSTKSSESGIHSRQCDPDKQTEDLKYFQTLKEKFQKRLTVNNMFDTTSNSEYDGLRASYNITFLIAKTGKPHTIGEQLILPATEGVLKLFFTKLHAIQSGKSHRVRKLAKLRPNIEHSMSMHQVYPSHYQDNR